jgi:uncharacterized protein (DUF2141 family)
MKKRKTISVTPIPLLLVLFFCAGLLLSFQNPAILTIEINDLRNSKGKVALDLQDVNKNSIKAVFQEIENQRCIITIKNLNPGKYIIRYFHDENGNKELDTNWIGMPKEGIGFSNNAKGKFGPPKHEKTIFKFTGDTTMVCTPTYLK